MPTAPSPDPCPEPIREAPLTNPRRRAAAGDAGQFSPLRQPDPKWNVPTACAGANLQEGAVIAGKYEVEQVLGAGAMGLVVSARHLVLNERVAIKSLRPEVLDNPEAIARFMREARAAVRIKSEHVARVTDVGTFDDGSPFIVMEHLEGVDLSSWLKTYGPLPVAQAVEFVLQACEAIAEAHVLGIVHRDLKPANLFCIRRRDGSLAIKVLDFGISKVTEPQYTSSVMSMTDASALMGSPNYMSPEQLQTPRDVDHRTDIWSLGIILFELLAGTSPFGGESLPELIINITMQAPKSVRSIRPELPIGLQAVIDHCLFKNRGERYANVGELARALRPFGPQRAEAYVERVTGILESAGIGTTTHSPTPSCKEPEPGQREMRSEEQTKVTWGHTTPPSVHRRRGLVVAVLGGVATLGIALLAFNRSTTGVTSNGPAAASAHAPNAAAADGPEPLVPPKLVDFRVAQASGIAAVNAPALSAESNSLAASRARGEPLERAASTLPAERDVTAKSKSNRGAFRVASPAAHQSTQPPSTRLLREITPSISPAKAACDPPYTFDALGRKHFKPECYLK